MVLSTLVPWSLVVILTNAYIKKLNTVTLTLSLKMVEEAPFYWQWIGWVSQPKKDVTAGVSKF